MIFLFLNTRNVLFLISVFSLFFFFINPVSSQSIQGNEKHILRIKFKEEQAKRIAVTTAVLNTQTGSNRIDKLNKEFKATSLKRVFPDAGKYEAKHRKYGLHLWYTLILDEAVDIDKAIQAYTNTGDIEVAEPVRLKNTKDAVAPKSESLLAQNALLPFNDPKLQYQWHFNNTGTVGSKPLADINLLAAWQQEQGKSNVIVAIMDDGIQVNHPDLAASIWINKNEIPANKIDDDNNGYVDDINGYDFKNNTGKITQGRMGTHVAGTISAVNNNGIGVAGIAGGTGSGDGVRLMSCTINTNVPDGVELAYIYAADNGAVISQNAWSYAEPNTYEQVVLDAIDYFIAEAGSNENGQATGPIQGGIVVFAAGDNGTVDQPYYPAAYNKVIAVAGTNSRDVHYFGSNIGTWVDLSAPADNIYSTTIKSSYGSERVTASASAVVSGVAALIISKYANRITPQEVWGRLINTTDKIETLPAGHGSGRLNALNALLDNDRVAPRLIPDLQITEIQQNSATLNWTTPIEESGLTPYSYEIRYSISPITNLNFAQAKLALNPPFPLRAPGRQTSTVTGLQSGTKYYFAIKSSDLFGNKSGISNVVFSTTVRAPLVKVLSKPVTIDIDVNQNPSGQFNIALKNEGKGIFQYFTDIKYLASMGERANAASLETPTLKSNNFLPKDDGKNFIDSIYYDAKSEVADDILAENEDSTVSTATKYIVTQPFFALTHVRSYYKMYGGEADSIVLQIYKGGRLPEKGKLLLTQRVFGQNIEGDFFTFSLNQTQHFAQNDTFWIILKYPQVFIVNPGHDLGLPSKSIVERNYYSINERPWVEMDNCLKVRALSKSAPTSWITLNPPNGTIAPTQTQTISVNANGKEQINGTHNFNIILACNDSIRPSITIPATVRITGQKPHIASSTLLLEFDPVATGSYKDKVIELYNKGKGALKIRKIALFDPAFKVVNGIDSLIKPGGKTSVTLRYKPVTSKPVTSKIEVSSTDPNTPVFKIAVTGGFDSSMQLPKLAIQPGVPKATVNAGETTQVNITFKNTGTYPATFSFPGFEEAQTEHVPAKPGLTAYTWMDNSTPDGPVFIWDDIATSGTKLSIPVQAVSVQLPFTFKFYDKYFKEISITNDGFLSFNNNSSEFNKVHVKIPYSLEPNNIIAPFWASLNPSDDASAVYVKKESSRFIVQYTNVPHRQFSGRISFQAILYKNGDIEFLYKIIEEWNGVRLIGIENEDGTEGISLKHVEIADGLAIKIYYPGPNFINQVSASEGVLLSGEEQSIKVGLYAANLIEGVYKQQLAVSSNDTINVPKSLTFELTVHGKPLLKAEKAIINFDTIFIERSRSLPVVISNIGSKAVEIVNIIGINAPFQNTFGASQILEPTFRLTTNVTFTPQQAGKFTGKLKVITKNGSLKDTTELVLLQGYGVISSNIVVNPAAINHTVKAGNNITDTITISNTGGFPLTYTVGKPRWVDAGPITSKTSASQLSTFAQKTSTLPVDSRDSAGYSWQDNKTSPSVIKYNWAEISITGRKLNILRDNSDPVKLPFKFPFYGAYYDAVSISKFGFLSPGNFLGDIEGSFINNSIPDPEYPNNIIAGLWDDLYSRGGKGIFCWSAPDVFIVQYDKVPHYNFQHSGDVTFQILLYPNGDIKFQYKDVNMATFKDSTTVGIENVTGTDGLQIAYQEEYLHDSLAVFIKAPLLGAVPPGKSTEIKLILNTSTLEAGTYETSLILKNNDIHHPSVIIPIKINVIESQSAMVYPNPVQTSATIKYSLEADNQVKIELLDKEGALKGTLINTFQKKGNHSVDLNRGMLPSGTYYYRLHIGNSMKVYRIVVK